MKHKICVVGVGYVGLPLALALDKHFSVTAYDISKTKIESLSKGKSPLLEIMDEEIIKSNIEFSNNPEVIKKNNFIIVCVPTPVDESNKPNLDYLKKATETIGENLQKGSIVVYESTVYPGATEEECIPILEKKSGLIFSKDFKIGYSPERVNPGDEEHTISNVIKIIAGSDIEAKRILKEIYGKITTVHIAPTIRVGEAAKVIENIQRDLNIALMNELKIIFDKLNINFEQVLEAAGTKWNFHKYYPGLVGGHCIPVDPYYLTYKANLIGHHPEVILAGRRINDEMYKYYAEKIIKKLIEKEIPVKNSKVAILGLTFKANVADYRNSKVKNLIEELKKFGVQIIACDPLLDQTTTEKEFGVKNNGVEKTNEADLKIITVKHDVFKDEKGYNLNEL